MNISPDISCYPITKTKKEIKRSILPKVTLTNYLIPRNAPHPSRSIVPVILMGILFIILITTFTHKHLSYATPILK